LVYADGRKVIESTVMTRVLSLLLLLTMAPQVLLPAEATFCICEAIRCLDCGCCAPGKAAEKVCCARCAAKQAPASVTSGRPCRGCLHLVQDSQPQARPEPRSASRDLAAAPPVADIVAAVVFELPQATRLSGWKAVPRPFDPPDLRRALPLLI
jgi:hypothetical protein